MSDDDDLHFKTITFSSDELQGLIEYVKANFEGPGAAMQAMVFACAVILPEDEDFLRPWLTFWENLLL